MHARSTTLTGDPGAIDAGIDFVRDEVMPAIVALEGCVGLSLVVDRAAGRAVATSSWRDTASMYASDEVLQSFRRRGQQILGGTILVEEWEVAVMHRDHATTDGSWCRVTWARADDVAAVVEGWRTGLLPRIEQLDGFCSTSLLVDRARGLGCATVTFDSRAALEATREASAGIRELATTTLGAEILGIEEFTLEIAHLRLPELV